MNVSFDVVNKATKATTKSGIERLSRFIERNAKDIAEFLLSSSKYKSFHLDITKNSFGNITAGMAAYEDGQTHHYLQALTREELKRCIKELEDKE